MVVLGGGALSSERGTPVQVPPSVNKSTVFYDLVLRGGGLFLMGPREVGLFLMSEVPLHLGRLQIGTS